MTKRHVIDFYMDGHVAISFCKLCSAEGLKLFDECPGKIEKPLDEMNSTAKSDLLKTEE